MSAVAAPLRTNLKRAARFRPGAVFVVELGNQAAIRGAFVGRLVLIRIGLPLHQISMHLGTETVPNKWALLVCRVLRKSLKHDDIRFDSLSF